MSFLFFFFCLFGTLEEITNIYIYILSPFEPITDNIYTIRSRLLQMVLGLICNHSMEVCFAPQSYGISVIFHDRYGKKNKNSNIIYKSTSLNLIDIF